MPSRTKCHISGPFGWYQTPSSRSHAGGSISGCRLVEATWSTTVATGGLVDNEDDCSSLSLLTEEQWLEKRQESFRPRTWRDLAPGLHQENGYHEIIGTT